MHYLCAPFKWLTKLSEHFLGCSESQWFYFILIKVKKKLISKSRRLSFFSFVIFGSLNFIDIHL